MLACKIAGQRKFDVDEFRMKLNFLGYTIFFFLTQQCLNC